MGGAAARGTSTLGVWGSETRFIDAGVGCMELFSLCQFKVHAYLCAYVEFQGRVYRKEHGNTSVSLLLSGLEMHAVVLSHSEIIVKQ